MNKFGKMVLIISVMALTAGMLSANGTREGAYGAYGSEIKSEVSMEGTLTEQNGRLLFSSEGSLYTISAPGYPRSGFSPEQGTILYVEGSLMAPFENCPFESVGHLIITAAEADGKRYDFDSGARFSQANRGPRRNRSGARYRTD